MPTWIASLTIVLLWLADVVAVDPSSTPRIRQRSDTKIEIRYGSDPDSYFVLHSARSLEESFVPTAMSLGRRIDGFFSMETNGAQAYFRIEQLGLEQVRDQDQDELPDVFELRNAPYLDPLSKEDGLEDFDRDGIPNGAEFTQGTSVFRSQVPLRFSMRGAHGLLVDPDGSMWGWGWNGANELGIGDREHRLSPVRSVPDEQWLTVDTGRISTFAIASDGSLWAWGDIGGGINPPTRFDERKWKDVAGDRYYGLALLEDGSLWSWRFTDSKQIRAGLVQLGEDTDWEQIAVQEGFGAAIKGDGSLWVIGSLGEEIYGPFKQLGNARDWVSVTVNYDLALAIKRDRTLWAFGSLDRRLTDDRRASSKLPVRVGEDADWLSASAGAGHVAGLKRSGTVWAWGFNNSGQLGSPLSLERALAPLQIGSDADWIAVEAAALETAAMKEDGSIWIWGTQLGDGSTTPVAAQLFFPPSE